MRSSVASSSLPTKLVSRNTQGGKMSTPKWTISGLVCGLALAGCANQTSIIAGAIDSVGITAGAGTQEQGANLTVGYKGAKFAVVPASTQTGALLALEDGSGRRKGLSVFAMLGIDAKTASPEAAVEQVLAVGPAAEYYAIGHGGVTADRILASRSR